MSFIKPAGHKGRIYEESERAVETESRMVVARSWGRRAWEVVFNGDRVSVWKMEKFRRRLVGMAAQQRECI